MPRKKTLKEVKENVHKLSKGRVAVLSKEYIGNKKPLLLKCDCGNEFYRSYDKFISGHYFCRECMLKVKSQKLRKDIAEVISIIESNGCEYISGDYVNNGSILTLRCSCGNTFQKSFAKFCSGQTCCIECGKKHLADSKRKYTIDDAIDILSSYGYTLIENEFRGAAIKHKCICKEGHECEISLSGLLQNRSGCWRCMIENKKGVNHHNYNGGTSKISELIRTSLKDWKSSIRASYSDCCPITGDTGDDCVVHHLTSLKTIFNNEVEKSGENVPFTGHLKDFSDYGAFESVKIGVLKKHGLRTGVLVSQKIHNEFHSIYGRFDNTPHQFDEFLKAKYNTTLADIFATQRK